MQVFGLLGNPVGHSLSPPMHEAAYEALGIEAKYVTFEPERGAIEAAIEGADALGIAGLNVTIPFKQEVLSLVNPDEQAVRVGAVNTIDFSTSPPTGYNTDVSGVLRSFSHAGVDIAGRRAVLLGAGGAGRAVAYALSDQGVELTVLNRTVTKAQTLAKELPAAEADALSAAPEYVPKADILVNATSVGMETDESPIEPACLHEELVVMDAVYRPLQTKLLADAEAVGATTIDGAWMLLFQGVEAFECWTGREAPVEEMNAALRASL